MADFHLVDPHGWEYDLQSVYSAYMGYFQLHSIPWYDRSWGHLFETFEEFLGFSWPAITVTDSWTGRAHVVTRFTSIGAFVKMIKTRFGETLPTVDNMLKVSPFETSQRHLRNINDWATYKKMHSTLPAVALAAFKARVRSGEPKAIREIWSKRDKTFIAVDFEWSERNNASCLEWGYAAVRCGHLEAVGAWPPVPDTNYRKGHYIIAEYADKVHNKHCPTYPWQYAFGDSQVIPKIKLPQIVQAVISSLISPESESSPNQLVLVGHGIQGDIQRLEEMKIKLPHNVLVIDTAAFERTLFNTGKRGSMRDPKTGRERATGATLSLGALLHSLNIDVKCALHNAGNDAFMCLLALQKLLDSEGTALPDIRNGKVVSRNASPIPRGMSASPIAGSYGLYLSPIPSPQTAGFATIVPPQSQSLNSRPKSRFLKPDISRGSGAVDLSVDEMGNGVRRMPMRVSSEYFGKTGSGNGSSPSSSGKEDKHGAGTRGISNTMKGKLLK
ncbi:hypothetical protein BJ138DRAFT_1123448 [Hygrophoropsis aurantiaca]|uniref:Uncharacterized protein n=1 Tax=Hygrophoropsis aurantiaca TaxID=72124 RepID=A0ACB8AMS0_9AGAM|nr:hypothetical protein BJ138DRAFT_1123448 [Hygrophoropsis aurantiaca]